MPNSKRTVGTRAAAEPLQMAIDLDAYEYLADNAESYLAAVEQCLAAGMSPEEIRRYFMRQAGPDRVQMAYRLEQAARHIQRVSD